MAGELVERLTKSEAAELARQERRISKALPGFIEVGEALSIIRDRRLYRATHPSFDAYVAERWGLTRQRAIRRSSASVEEITVLRPRALPRG